MLMDAILIDYKYKKLLIETTLRADRFKEFDIMQ